MKKTLKNAVLLCLVATILCLVSCNKQPAHPQETTPVATTPAETTPEETTPEVTTPEETSLGETTFETSPPPAHPITPEDPEYSQGLEFTFNDDGESVSITGIGNCEDTNVVISATCSLGLPVTAIGAGAFKWCEFLTSIYIPDSITSIGHDAFYGCYSLTSITIPNSITSIGDYTFASCYSLTSIVIPNSVTSIYRNTFIGCESLTSITFEGTVAQWNAIELDWGWDLGIPATEVICSDGVVSLN